MKSTTSSCSSYGTAPQPDTRDRDLLTVDSVLTDEALDKLWNWYSDAVENALDPQMIFVKFVNSVRKPYIEQLEHQQRTLFPFGNSVAATSRGCDTPSEAGTVVAGEQYEGSWSTRPQSEDTPLIHLEPKPVSHSSSLFDDAGENDHEGPSRDILKSLIIPPRIIKPICVAIKSADFPNSFVQLKGNRVTSFMSGGGGSAHVGGPKLTESEIFELERLENGIVAFKSTTNHNVYLRADPQGLRSGERRSWGGGVVNCQFSCGMLERFRIHKAGENGQVAIEPAEHPGTYLRVNGMTSNGINLQGVRSDWERFFIVVVV